MKSLQFPILSYFFYLKIYTLMVSKWFLILIMLLQKKIYFIEVVYDGGKWHVHTIFCDKKII